MDLVQSEAKMATFAKCKHLSCFFCVQICVCNKLDINSWFCICRSVLASVTRPALHDLNYQLFLKPSTTFVMKTKTHKDRKIADLPNKRTTQTK